MKSVFLIPLAAFFAVGALSTIACTPNQPEAATAPVSQTVPAPKAAPSVAPLSASVESVAAVNPPFIEKWLGKWTGPEGTFLLLSRKGTGYTVGIQDLDRLRTYPAQIAGDHFEFSRDGKSEMLRAGNGKDTGMKWLLEKKDCLFVRSGEGFCRD